MQINLRAYLTRKLNEIPNTFELLCLNCRGTYQTLYCTKLKSPDKKVFHYYFPTQSLS